MPGRCCSSRARTDGDPAGRAGTPPARPCSPRSQPASRRLAGPSRAGSPRGAGALLTGRAQPSCGASRSATPPMVRQPAGDRVTELPLPLWAHGGHERGVTQATSAIANELRRRFDLHRRPQAVMTDRRRHPAGETHNPWVVGSSPTRPPQAFYQRKQDPEQRRNPAQRSYSGPTLEAQATRKIVSDAKRVIPAGRLGIRSATGLSFCCETQYCSSPDDWLEVRYTNNPYFPTACSVTSSSRILQVPSSSRSARATGCHVPSASGRRTTQRS